jgi:hypothetical protein
MELIAMKCTRHQYESIKEYIGELQHQSEGDFTRYKYLTNSASGICSMEYGPAENKTVYRTFDKDIFLKACGLVPIKTAFEKAFENTDSQKLALKLGEAYKDFIKKADSLGGAEITPEQLKGLTHNRKEISLEDLFKDFNPFPHVEWLASLGTKSFKPEPKSLKIGSIYKGKIYGAKYLIKISSDEGSIIYGDAFVNGKFYKGATLEFSKKGFLKAKSKFKETSLKKWNKALKG